MGDEDLIRVAATSHPFAVAGAIAGLIRRKGRVVVQAIGAGAVNQAIKAVAWARCYLEGDNMDAVCLPSFTEVVVSERETTALRLDVLAIRLQGLNQSSAASPSLQKDTR